MSAQDALHPLPRKSQPAPRNRVDRHLRESEENAIIRERERKERIRIVTIRAEHDPNHGLTIFLGQDRLALDSGVAHQPHSRPGSVELLIASLAACMASSGEHFLRRAGLDGGLKVECDFEMSDTNPGHVTRIHFAVAVPPGIPTGRREALVRVFNHCAVHNPLHRAPTVDVAVRDDQENVRQRSDSQKVPLD